MVMHPACSVPSAQTAIGAAHWTNEMFKIYVRLRSSIYDGLDYRVEDAWEALQA